MLCFYVFCIVVWTWKQLFTVSSFAGPASLQIHVSEQSTPATDEANGGEVHNPHENVDVPTVEEEIPEEEIPVAEVVDEVQEDSQMVVESSAQNEEVQKKTYASIVSVYKLSTGYIPSHLSFHLVIVLLFVTLINT